MIRPAGQLKAEQMWANQHEGDDGFLIVSSAKRRAGACLGSPEGRVCLWCLLNGTSKVCCPENRRHGGGWTHTH
jgi:hypothetical protein